MSTNSNAGLGGAARAELGRLAFYLLCWLAFVVLALAGYPLAGYLRLSLYHLYGLAASGGWLLGNVEVNRERRLARRGAKRLPPKTRRRLFWLSVFAPSGVFYLLWSFVPDDMRHEFPMAPLYASGVFVVLFLVPVSLKRVFSSS